VLPHRTPLRVVWDGWSGGLGLDDRTRAAILRRMHAAGGINVLCVRCGARGKHLPGAGRRLRDRPCPKCGGRLRAL